MYHISEIIEGWPRPFWVEEEEGVPGAEDEADAHSASGGTGWAATGLERWRVAAVVVLVLGLGAALFVVSRSSGQVAAGVAAPAAALPSEGQAAGDGVIDAAERALEAWGRFAVNGELSILEPWFAAGGPQMTQLRAEAGALAASPISGRPYEFLLEQPRVLEDGPLEQVVRGDVVVQRPGEQPQRYEWEIEMRRSAEKQGWLLWTVKTVD
jgi:hypothetical protein